MTIKILSDSTINKIAAGEVIERPASVVKELVENAIDSGATNIDILLECAGKNLIVIRDNGCGMSKEELELAVQRHATSKLDEDDLLNINSFGFRGEALPSVGAISKFTITSKKHSESKAYSISIIGGKQHNVVESYLPEGTRVEVRDLFFATPARLKFLLTDKKELNASIQMVKKIALAHPHISLHLAHNGKSLIKVSAETREKRISSVLGNDFFENAAKVDFSADWIKIQGFCSIPTYNRASTEDQFLFINNRPVKDKLLSVALRVAYQDYLERNRHAVCVLFLEIEPHYVDVNVHPAKSEVRFHDPGVIRSMVIKSINEALRSSSDRVSTATTAEMIKKIQPFNVTEQSRALKEDVLHDASKFRMPIQDNAARSQFSVPKSHTNFTPPTAQNIAPRPFIETKPVASNPASNSGVMTESQQNNYSAYRLGAAKAQIYNTYIISQTQESMVITDQHAAHERIGYEKIKKQIADNGLIKQRLLIPEVVEFVDVQKAEILDEYKQEIAKYGMTIEKFGEKSIIVHELPSIVGDVNPRKIVEDLADHLLSMGENIVLSELIEHITETYACHYAIRAGRKLNLDEMNELLRQMENTPFSGQCNHGRQTYVELKLKDIEKLFGRR